ncbi:MAG: multicopper oxidase domain-containing protein [Chloroflexi bacterium]|nr:multicopper oxidase domain-containing protein [Chloroflexota bacterium]
MDLLRSWRTDDGMAFGAVLLGPTSPCQQLRQPPLFSLHTCSTSGAAPRGIKLSARGFMHSLWQYRFCQTVDLHTPHFHGQTFLMNGMRNDVAELLPMSMKVVDMVPDNPGTWLVHCHVNDHLIAGMSGLFTVTQ